MFCDFLKGFAITIIVLLYLFIPVCICFEAEISGYGVLWLVFNLIAMGVGFNYSYNVSSVMDKLSNNVPSLLKYSDYSYKLKSICKRNSKIIVVYDSSSEYGDDYFDI